jgi:hypothetical protein
MTDQQRQEEASPPTALSLLAAWAGIGGAAGFLSWVVEFGAAGAGGPPIALGSYARSLLVGLAASAAVVGLDSLRGQATWLARASYASCLLYAGFLTTLAGSWWPWFLLAAALLLLVALRRRDLTHAAVELLLLHSMGTLGALYACFQLPNYLAGWPAFREVADALWLVLTSAVS